MSGEESLGFFHQVGECLAGVCANPDREHDGKIVKEQTANTGSPDSSCPKSDEFSFDDMIGDADLKHLEPAGQPTRDKTDDTFETCEGEQQVVVEEQSVFGSEDIDSWPNENETGDAILNELSGMATMDLRKMHFAKLCAAEESSDVESLFALPSEETLLPLTEDECIRSRQNLPETADLVELEWRVRAARRDLLCLSDTVCDLTHANLDIFEQLQENDDTAFAMLMFSQETDKKIGEMFSHSKEHLDNMDELLDIIKECHELRETIDVAEAEAIAANAA